MAEIRIKDIDEHEIDTILAEDIDFEGHLTFKKPLMIKGKFKGEITSTSALYIGEKAYVEATTEADVVSSKGRHKGDIVGRSRVELFSTAQVDGDISTPDFVVESGCKFNGNCNMSGEKTRKEETVAASAPAGGGLAPAAGPGTQPRPGGEPARSAPEPSHGAEAPRASGGAQPPQQQKPLFQQGGPGGQGGARLPPGGQK